MKHALSILILLALAAQAHAATWYFSRDGNGAATGADYANRATRTKLKTYLGDGNLAKGGNTFWLADDWLCTDAVNYSITIKGSGSAADGNLVIRGDVPGHPARVLRGLAFAGGSWSGPDAAGYYCYSSYPADTDSNIARRVVWNMGAASEEAPPERTVTAAADANGYLCDPNGLYLLKLSGGTNPATGTAYWVVGYPLWFAFSNQSYIAFVGLEYRFAYLPSSHTLSTHITFDSVKVTDCASRAYRLYYGNDYWTWVNCIVHRAQAGIYAEFDNGYDINWGSGKYGTVIGGDYGWFGPQGGSWNDDQDAHGIATQASYGWVVRDANVHHCSTAIYFYGGANPPGGIGGNHDNVAIGNYVHDTRCYDADGNVEVQTDPSGIVLATDANMIAVGNLLVNIGSYGIYGGSEVSHNTIWNSGFKPQPWAGNLASAIMVDPNAIVRNNVIDSNCRFFYGLSAADLGSAVINGNTLIGTAGTAFARVFGTSGTVTEANWLALGFDANYNRTAITWGSATPYLPADFVPAWSVALWNRAPVLDILDRNGRRTWGTPGAYAPVRPTRFGVAKP